MYSDENASSNERVKNLQKMNDSLSETNSILKSELERYRLKEKILLDIIPSENKKSKKI